MVFSFIFGTDVFGNQSAGKHLTKNVVYALMVGDVGVRCKNSSDRKDSVSKAFHHFASQIFQGFFIVTGNFFSDFLWIWMEFYLKLHDHTIAVQPGFDRN
jgi:hypothetical protein